MQETFSPVVLLKKIGEILEAREYRVSNYEIMGYVHLETLLRIYYRDRDEVILLRWVNGGQDLEVDFNFTEKHPEDHTVTHTQDWVKRYKRLGKY